MEMNNMTNPINKPTKVPINPPFLVRMALKYVVSWHHWECLKDGINLTAFKGDVAHEQEAYRVIIFNKAQMYTSQKIKPK